MSKEETAVIVFLLIMSIVVTFKMILIKDKIADITTKPQPQKIYEKH